jgi:murein DD-endopeptidase MepM/ murein hydrolase activator NlpD
MRRRRKVALILLALTVAAFLLPEWPVVPVQGATVRDWNPRSFWYDPWGRSGVHKGIDIFARKGTPVCAPTYGIVLFAGTIEMGGRVVVMLGPKWRLHYFAHLDAWETGFGRPVGRGHVIGRVGDSGNAAGKQPHLHYSVVTIIPYPWRWDATKQGWRKMFYLDPGRWLRG